MALVAFAGSREHELVHVNEALARITGYSEDEMIGKPISLFLPRRARTIPPGSMTCSSLPAATVTRWSIKSSTPTVTCSGLMSVSAIMDADGEPEFQVVQIQDISDRRRYEGRLEFLAEHGPLTGLFNRRRFTFEVQSQVARVRRHSSISCVLFLDIDNFKYINDSLGHSAGDDLIEAVAMQLLQTSRETDIGQARW